MIGDLHFHRGYSLRLQESKPLKNNGIISYSLLPSSSSSYAGTIPAGSHETDPPLCGSALMSQHGASGRHNHATIGGECHEVRY
jgi:hypothetical protein